MKNKHIWNGLGMAVLMVGAAIACMHGIDPAHAALLSVAGIGLATNYVQDGDHLTLTAPYARSAGEGAQIGAIFGVALSDVANGADTEWATEGVWTLTALSTDTASQGDRAYWDDTNKEVVNTANAGANILIGAYAVAKTAAQATATIKLNEAVPA